MSDALDLTLREAAEWIAAGKIGAAELLDEALAAVRKFDHVTNAVIGISEERARAEARRLDSLPPDRRGPLHGIPLAHKDMYYRAGEITTCGSAHRRDCRMDATATLLSRLDAAGAISFARLNMAQFAMGPTGHNPDFGRCRNPFAPERISGGSSSGSAATVAARYAFASLGSDTGGSVRLPAALCGVVGLKPTQGLLPLDGVMGLSESLDAPGPVARASGDIARLMDVLAEEERYEAALERDPSELVVGVPTSYYCDDLSPEIARNYEEAIAMMRSLGVAIRSVDIPDHSGLADLADAIWKPEAAALHLSTLQSAPDRLAPQARARLTQGLATSAVDYIRARQLRGLKLGAMLEGPLSRCDAILTPALRIAPPLASEVEASGGEEMRRNLEAITAFTRPLNFLGLPGLVTPSGLAASGAPLAIQLIGRPRREDVLLRLGHAFEKAGRFNTLRPPFLDEAAA